MSGWAVLIAAHAVHTVVGADAGTAFSSARTWHYQLQRVQVPELVASSAEVLVIDGEDESRRPWAPETLETLKLLPDGGRRVVLAYLSIGEAEDYRADFKPEWRRRRPSWILAENPEWRGNYPVRFWDPEWNQIVDARVERLIRQGFDGLYLDRVDVTEHPGVARAYAKACSADCPQIEVQMAALVGRVARRARELRAGALVVPQNGIVLLERLSTVVDGWAIEDTYFHGERRATTAHTRWVEETLQRLRGRAPVLAVDYIRRKRSVDEFTRRATASGYLAFAAPSRALDRGPRSNRARPALSLDARPTP